MSRTFYARGQTGQQLLLGAYQSLMRQVHDGHGHAVPAPRDARPRRRRRPGARHRRAATWSPASSSATRPTRCCSRTGGYGTVYYLSTNAVNSNVTAAWRAHKRGALFANPCFTQIHPTCIPVSGDHQSKLTLMSESLRNDGRVWVPKKQGDKRPPEQIPEAERDYYLERRVPELRQPRAARRRVARRQAGVRRRPRRRRHAAWRSISTSPTRSSGSASRRHQGSATATCSTCTSRSPTRTRTRCRCASTPPSTTRWAACGWTTT